MLKVVSLLFVACLASADRVENINQILDYGLRDTNRWLTDRGLGLFRISDQTFEEVELKNGVQVGANSLERVGDATLTVSEDGSVSKVDFHFGWHLFASAIGSIRSGGLEFSGLVHVRDNSFHVALTLDAKPPCNVTLDHFRFDRLADAQFFGSLPETDRDLTGVFSEKVLPSFNQKVEQMKPLIESALQRIVCRSRGRQNVQSDVVNFFATVFDHLETNGI